MVTKEMSYNRDTNERRNSKVFLIYNVIKIITMSSNKS